jgi:hypothetical protein
MKTILINTETMADAKIFLVLAKKLGFNSHVLSEEEKEDIGLYKAMLKAQKTKFVSREQVMKKLNSIK